MRAAATPSPQAYKGKIISTIVDKTSRLNNLKRL